MLEKIWSTSSFVAGSIILLVNKKHQLLTTIIISITVIILNFSYFKEDIWFKNLTDSQKLSSEEIVKQSGAGLKDYWPKYSQDFPTSYAPDQPIVSNDVVVTSYTKKSNKVNLTIFSKSDTKITIPLTYFPNWQLFIDDKKTNFTINKELGLIEFNLSAGKHSVLLKLFNTPIRTISNLVSVISLALAIIISIKPKQKNEK